MAGRKWHARLEASSAGESGRKGHAFCSDPLIGPFCMQRVMNKILSTNTSHLCAKGQASEIITCNFEDLFPCFSLYFGFFLRLFFGTVTLGQCYGLYLTQVLEEENLCVAAVTTL